MTNIKSKFSDINIVTSTLTDKKQQTDYKIKYVSEYVNQWAIISSERDEITDITFIDCMCNAGVYQDGDLCTATMPYSLVLERASGIHNNSVQREAEPTHLHVLCSVSASSSIF